MNVLGIIISWLLLMVVGSAHAMNIEEAKVEMKRVLKEKHINMCLLPASFYHPICGGYITAKEPSIIVGDFNADGRIDMCALLKEVGAKKEKSTITFNSKTHVLVFMKLANGDWKINILFGGVPFCVDTPLMRPWVNDGRNEPS